MSTDSASQAPAGPSSTPTYKREKGLTIPQHNAIDLLVSGLTDPTVAERLGLDRSTVTRWRLYDDLFRETLKTRREEVWRESLDAARSLLPTALDALRTELADGDLRGRLALDVLRAAGIFGRLTADAAPKRTSDSSADQL